MEELTQNNIAINSDDANRRIESSADYRKEVVSGRAIGSNRGGRTVSTLAAPTRKEFVFVNPNDIPFDGKEEWLIKGVAPKTGVMALWGKSGVGKTFIALDMARRVAAGWPWAGLRVKQGLVAYICAEGHGGFPKRIEGHRRTNPDMPRDTPFRVLNEAPNLGTESGDLEILIKGIDRIGEVPALIVIDTLAQTLGNGDENGPGMVQFLSNANALARRYGCLVLVVHHEGHTADRARGHSSFGAALDASLRIERSDDKLTSFISVKKVKDGEDDIRLKVMFRKQLLCCDEDGDPVTTLAVTAVEKTTEVASKQEKPKALPANSALMMDVIREQIDQMGQRFQPEKGAPSVKGVSDDVIRDEYYRRIAEQAEPGEDVERLASRKRKEFNRAIKNLLKGKHI